MKQHAQLFTNGTDTALILNGNNAVCPFRNPLVIPKPVAPTEPVIKTFQNQNQPQQMRLDVVDIFCNSACPFFSAEYATTGQEQKESKLNGNLTLQCTAVPKKFDCIEVVTEAEKKGMKKV